MRVVGFISCCESGTEAEDGVGAGAGAFGGALDGFGSAAGLAILGRDAERERGTATGSVDDLRLPRCCISAGAVFGGTGGSTISAALAARLGAGERARRVILVAGGICLWRYARARVGPSEVHFLLRRAFARSSIFAPGLRLRRGHLLLHLGATMRLRIADAAPPMRAASKVMRAATPSGFSPPLRNASAVLSRCAKHVRRPNAGGDPQRGNRIVKALCRAPRILAAGVLLEGRRQHQGAAICRDASTGFKDDERARTPSATDFLQLNAELSAAVLVAFSWVGVAILTGVLGEHRLSIELHRLDLFFLGGVHDAGRPAALPPHTHHRQTPPRRPLYHVALKAAAALICVGAAVRIIV